MALAEEGRQEEALAFFRSNMAATGVTLSGISSEWIEHNRELGSTAARAALTAIEENRFDILAADAAALLLTGLLGFVTFRRIVKPIQRSSARSRRSPPGTTRSRFRLPTPPTKPAVSPDPSRCSSTVPPR